MAPGLIKYFPKGQRASLSSCQAESTEGKRRKSRTEESSREQEAEGPAATKTVGLPPPKCNSKSGHRVSPQPESRRSQGILQSHHAPESPKPRLVQQCLSPRESGLLCLESGGQETLDFRRILHQESTDTIPVYSKTQ